MMKFKFTSVLFVIGLCFGLGPWLLIEHPSAWWYPISVIGGLMVTFVGYDAQASMVGTGEPGEDILQNGWRWIKAKLRKLTGHQPPDQNP